MKRVIAVASVLIACRAKPAPVVEAAAPIDASRADAMLPDAQVTRSDAGRRPWDARGNSVDALAVSSRVDNGTESPSALVDGDLDTAWSSRTGDLVGAWVALRLFNHRDELHAVELTVGMTKDPELFKQNVRIAEVTVSFAPITNDKTHELGAETVLADHFKLDTESIALQKIPITAHAPGIVKITVTAIKAGTKAAWREATISEIKLDDADGALATTPFELDVGSFDPKPRGILGIVPEQRVTLGCLAALPNVPKAYCVLGQWGSTGKAAELMTLDKDGTATIAPLTGDFGSPMIPYASWLRAEHELAGGITLAASKDKWQDIPWKGTVEIQGATFRQRETQNAPGTDQPDMLNGVLEVRFAGVTSFTQLFDETAPAATSPMIAGVRPLGSLWLVERSMSHGSEGFYVSEAEAAMCNLQTKHCTTFTMPASQEERR